MSPISHKRLLDSLFDGVYYVDRDRKIIFWNKAAERIRVFIETSFLVTQGTRLNVTASLGATMALPDDTPDSVIQRADSLMYQSKTSGRNRVTTG